MSKIKSLSLDPAHLDNLCIDTIRFLSVDAVEKANSGHPGLPMGAAPMAYVLWTRFGVDRFGASAPGEVMMREFGLTVDNVYKHAMKLMDQKRPSKRIK